MIRHGAEYGSSAVDGSSLLSELDPQERSEKWQLRKYFLKDGAYQWMHIIKVGGEHTFKQVALLPFTGFLEVGFVFSYFTNIDNPFNGDPQRYRIVDTPEYPKSTAFIVNLGIRLFL
jgi:hypothetical protein